MWVALCNRRQCLSAIVHDNYKWQMINPDREYIYIYFFCQINANPSSHRWQWEKRKIVDRNVQTFRSLSFFQRLFKSLPSTSQYRTSDLWLFLEKRESSENILRHRAETSLTHILNQLLSNFFIFSFDFPFFFSLFFPCYLVPLYIRLTNDVRIRKQVRQYYVINFNMNNKACSF